MAPEGSIGRGRKGVKKNAALLHFLAFAFSDHIIGVPRGEQPLSRGLRVAHERARFAGWRRSLCAAKRLPRNSGTFFVSFLVTKKESLAAAAHDKRPCRKVGRAGSHPIKKQKSNKHLRTSWRQLRHRWQRRGGCAPGGRGYPYFPLENPAKIVRPRKTRHSGNHLQIVLVTQ